MRIIALFVALLISSPAFASWEASGGDTDNINCGSAAALDDMSPYTILAWVYTPSLAGTTARRLFVKGTSNPNRMQFFWHNSLDEIRSFRDRVTTISLGETTTSTMVASTWMYLATRFSSGRAGTCTTSDQTGCDIQVLTGSMTALATMVTGTWNSATDGSGALNTDAASNVLFGGDAGTESVNAIVGRAMVVEADLTDAQIRMLQFAPIGVWNSFSNSRVIIHPFDTGNTPDMSGQLQGPSSGACTVTGGALGAVSLPIPF